MSMQKYKSKSNTLKQHTLLPSIANKLTLIEEHLKMKPNITEKNSHGLRGVISKALENKQEIPWKQNQSQNTNNLVATEKRSDQLVILRERMQKYLSTPKLGSKSPQKLKSRAQMSERYLKNERLSIELKLPKAKKLNLSLDSDEQQIQNAMFKEQTQQKIQPVVYVLKQNPTYGFLQQTSANKLYSADSNQGKNKLELVQNNQVIPAIPSLPTRHPPIHSVPKSEKYIKEKFVGQEAINKFYNRYKNIERVRELQSFHLQLNPITTILTILQSYNIPPKKMEVIKLKGAEAILDLRNCALGSSVSIKAIAEIIQKVDIFQEIDLSYNQITPDLTDVIIPNLIKMRRIDLSYNKIGRRGIELLSAMLWNQQNDEDCQLCSLNLQSNNINDSSFGNFFTNLTNMNSLVVLNLSKNCLGNVAANRLKQFLMNDDTLAELYLHWCELGFKATKLIFQGLAKNYGLRVLDISWNQVGLDGIAAFCKFVKQNLALLHLDLSYCEIDFADTKKIAKVLKQNHSIYGIHYQGNMGYIDYKGYLHPIGKQDQETPISIRAGLIQRINSINILYDYKRYHPHTSAHENVCWICEGWQQRYFRVSKEQGQKGCFLHLDFQLYSGRLMNDKVTYYQLLRMCPPKQINFFFTKLTTSNKFIHLYDTHPLGQPKLKESINQIPEFMIEKKKFKMIQLQKINIIEQPVYYGEIFNEDYITRIHCQPRSDDMRAEHLIVPLALEQKLKPRKEKKQKKKNMVTVKKQELIKEIKVKEIPQEFDTVFNKQTGEGDSYEEFIRKCVDFDINNSKVSRFIKNPTDLKDVKSMLEKHYDLFQKIYYYLANNNPNSNGVYSINETRFQKFIDEQGYETKRVTKAKIRVKLISCLSHINSETEIQSFYRPQFFQFLLRLAIEKWCIAKREEEGSKECTIGEAFQKMLKSLRKYSDQAESDKWREQNLTSYELSIVIKSYGSILELIYQKYAGLLQKNMNTKAKKKMFLEEYKIMMIDADIRKTRQTLKDLEIAYRTVKKLQIEDGIADTGIDYVQFLQSFCRFAEGLFLTPIGSENHIIWDKDLIQNEEIPLFLKVQKLLKIIYMKNYDIRTKKYDSILEHGLFAEQIMVLMDHYKHKYEHRDSFQRIYQLIHQNHIKMNSLQAKKGKITLGYLIELLAVKAAHIKEENRQRMIEMEAQRQRLEKEAKDNEGNEESEEQQKYDQF